jgi:3-methyladenine DNA glycosylase/8-oxoguanine DNA glycosylase
MTPRADVSSGHVGPQLPGHPVAELNLRGGGGEPVDLWRTLLSHGVAELPPRYVDEASRSLEVTLRVRRGRPRMVRVAELRPGVATLLVRGRAPAPAAAAELSASVRHVLRLEEDLSGFYARAADDPELAWVARGAGRMSRSPTVFEDVVKTICTTNCAWSATERMVGALVEHLGEKATGAPDSGARGRAFPTPAAMAEAGEGFYRDVARAGYRGRYLQDLARAVADERLDLEELGRASPDELSDDDVEQRLLSLPGVGPYAAAHVMMLVGRYSRLILDSWTRPTYLRVSGKRSATDAAIIRRFRRYGPFAGLAFWLFVTKDWVDDVAAKSDAGAPPSPV